MYLFLPPFLPLSRTTVRVKSFRRTRAYEFGENSLKIYLSHADKKFLLFLLLFLQVTSRSRALCTLLRLDMNIENSRYSRSH